MSDESREAQAALLTEASQFPDRKTGGSVYAFLRSLGVAAMSCQIINCFMMGTAFGQAQGQTGTLEIQFVRERAVLFEDDPSDPKGKQFVGSVVWLNENPIGPTGASDIAVRAAVEIPDRKLRMTMLLRRTADSSQPTSHTAELTFSLPPDFPGGGVDAVPAILMKSSEQEHGTPLVGIAVKATNGAFRFGLSNVDAADRVRNIKLLKEQAWFQIPLIYANGHRAFIVIEKGSSGGRLLNEALTAWGDGQSNISEDKSSGEPQAQPGYSPKLQRRMIPGNQTSSERAVLYEEDPSNPMGKKFAGSVVWRTEPTNVSNRRGSDIALRADIEFPDRKLKMTMLVQRNTDPKLPATHMAELTFTVPPDFPDGGIDKVPIILLKSNEQSRGTQLSGLSVKVTDNRFLFGLSSVEADRSRNLQLLKEQSWLDIPLFYTDKRRAIIAIEKGASGERAFGEAFAAWGE